MHLGWGGGERSRVEGGMKRGTEYILRSQTYHSITLVSTQCEFYVTNSRQSANFGLLQNTRQRTGANFKTIAQLPMLLPSGFWKRCVPAVVNRRFGADWSLRRTRKRLGLWFCRDQGTVSGFLQRRLQDLKSYFSCSLIGLVGWVRSTWVGRSVDRMIDCSGGLAIWSCALAPRKHGCKYEVP